jgi:glyoxalase family protein
MQLEGIHHVTAITGDARRNVDFYARVLGLRLVKKTVNQDDPTVYHLFYADEQGDPGSDITFFEYPGAAPGRAGDGMIHRVGWRVGSPEALDFWAERLAGEGVQSECDDGRLRFADPEGLEHELVISSAPDEPLIADHPEVPGDVALQGFDHVRAYSSQPQRSRALIEETLGFAPREGGWEARGQSRGGLYAYDEPPGQPGVPGGGTVHHVAWASEMDDHEAWRERVIEGGARPTPIIDRFWFHSIYFREPSGVLFEIATLGPGFTADEPLEHLGDTIVLPPFLESRRKEIERVLTPLPSSRAVREGASR